MNWLRPYADEVCFRSDGEHKKARRGSLPVHWVFPKGIMALDKTAGAFYKPSPPWRAQVAQLVEHATENRSVGGSIPPLGTIPKSEILR